jgi:predicted GIY-YIG superfamily endonuclease
MSKCVAKGDIVCYVIRCESNSRTYAGFSNFFGRRIRQHNCEIKGGSKYTTKFGNSDWTPLFIVKGFRY